MTASGLRFVAIHLPWRHSRAQVVLFVNGQPVDVMSPGMSAGSQPAEARNDRTRSASMTRLLLTSLLLLALAGCTTGPAKPPPGTLTANEVRALFSNQTVESVTFSKGRVSQIYYMANGELHQLRKGKVRTGSWRVNKKGRICLQIDEGDEKCRASVKAGQSYVKYIIRKDGSHEPVVRYISFQPGNPLGL